MQRLSHHDGHYDYLTGIDAFSSGVRSHPRFEIVRVVFGELVPWSQGFDRAEEHFDSERLNATALCSVELRCSKPYTYEGFDTFNEAYVNKLLSMGVFQKGQPTPVGRTNVAPIRHAPSEQSMLAFSYVRPAQTERAVSFVISGGGEVRGGVIKEDTIVRFGEVSGDAIAEKATFVLDVMSKRLEGLDLAWQDARMINAYSKHVVDGPIMDIIAERVGVADIHGLHRYPTAPPVEHIEFEMDVKGPTWELAWRE